MQPYFIPYAGYFRLFSASDLFIIYDCVQFPRRGWVHRNRLRMGNGELDWLTLPLSKAPQETRIDALRFSPERWQEWRDSWRKFPALQSDHVRETGADQALAAMEGTPVDYLERSLSFFCTLLGLPFNMRRSSALGLPEDVKGQERILAICEHFGCTEYINSPGGKELYDAQAFAARGMKLAFLDDYAGPMDSILQRLAVEGENALHMDILTHTRCTYA